MKNLLILTILLLSSCGVKYSQGKMHYIKIDKSEITSLGSVSVAGKIIDMEEKFPLPGSSIELKNSENNYFYTSNEKGEFSFNSIESGKYSIICNFVGYCTMKDSIEFKSGEKIKLNIGIGGYH